MRFSQSPGRLFQVYVDLERMIKNLYSETTIKETTDRTLFSTSRIQLPELSPKLIRCQQGTNQNLLPRQNRHTCHPQLHLQSHQHSLLLRQLGKALLRMCSRKSHYCGESEADSWSLSASENENLITTEQIL